MSLWKLKRWGKVFRPLGFFLSFKIGSNPYIKICGFTFGPTRGRSG